jgi:hypothetical protein
MDEANQKRLEEIKKRIGAYGIGPLRSYLVLDADMQFMLEQLDAERAKLNTPHTANFIEAVKLEAAHQRERWAAEHDAGKSDADWFWLIGYLAGKVLRPDNTPEKRLHHIITTAAVCLNWHAHRTGADTRMRPGIAPPESVDASTTGEEASHD